MNLHASLLPRYRGAAPIQWAIVRGETETGISLMQMDEGMDTGAVYTRRGIEILPEETSGELAERLAELAAVVVREDLPRAVAGELVAEPQDDSRATLAPPIRTEDSVVDWQKDAPEIINLVRGMTPRPGARTWLGDKLLKLLEVRLALANGSGPPGTVHVLAGRPIVQTGGRALELGRAQLEGRKATTGTDLVHGRVLKPGMRLSSSPA